MVETQKRRSRIRQVRAAAVSVVCGVGLCGCASVMSFTENIAAHATLASSEPETLRLRPLAPIPRIVHTRSYRTGEPYTARVGETMLSVKNYTASERVARASALRDFEQSCKRLLSREPGRCRRSPLEEVVGGMGGVFGVPGAVSTADGDYFAVAMPRGSDKETVYLLVDPEGRLRHGSYVVWRQADNSGYSVGGVPLAEVSPDIPLDADEPLFSFENQQILSPTGAGYLNYDLVYSGIRSTDRGDYFFIGYREYARETTDRVLFEQSLQYPVSQTDIDVAGLRLHVDEVGPESIAFRVVEDSPGGDQPQ